MEWPRPLHMQAELAVASKQLEAFAAELSASKELTRQEVTLRLKLCRARGEIEIEIEIGGCSALYVADVMHATYFAYVAHVMCEISAYVPRGVTCDVT